MTCLSEKHYNENDIIVFNTYTSLTQFRELIACCQFDISEYSYCIVNIEYIQYREFNQELTQIILDLIHIKSGKYHARIPDDGQFYTIDEIYGS